MRNIIMTGGTSGLGLETSKKLVKMSDIRLISGYRSAEVDNSINIPLDLANLSKVKDFANKAISALNNDKIDILICNAAVNYPSNNYRTDDDIEMNFGVNYIAHFYLIQLLTSYFSPKAKIILTTSGTINPEKKTLAPPPKHTKINWLAYPENDKTLFNDEIPNGQRAYSSSKICELLTAIYINKLNNNWVGISFDPGVTPGTGLARYASEEIKELSKQLANDTVRKEKFPESNSIVDAGSALADLAIGKIQLPKGKYVALRGGKIKFNNPPGLAQDETLPEKVWNETIILLKDKLFLPE